MPRSSEPGVRGGQTAGPVTAAPALPEGGQRLGKPERLRKRRDFLRVQAAGRRLSSPNLTLIVGEAPRAHDGPAGTRFGVTVSRKVGGAVQRNRLKRLFRESYRRHKALVPPGKDLVLIARPSCAAQSAHAIFSEVVDLLGRVRGAGPRGRGPIK